MSESLQRRLAAIESDLEPDTVEVRLRNDATRVYSKAEVMAALRDVTSGLDTPILREISEITGFRNDYAGLAGWIQLTNTIRYSRILLEQQENQDATKD